MTPPAAEAETVRTPSGAWASAPLPRVMLLLRDLTRGGATRLALSLFDAVAQDMSIRCVAWEGGPLEPDFRRLGPLQVLWSYPGLLPFPGAAAERRMAGMVVGRMRMPLVGWSARRSEPQLVYANSIRSLHLVSRLGLSGYPIVLHVHELSVALAGFEAANPGLIRSLPSHHIAVSQAVASALVTDFKVDTGSISVIPPFVAAPSTLATKRPGDGIYTVGGIGNLTWSKGGVLWLLAARDLVGAVGEENVRFRWVGLRENDEGRQFRAMIEKLGLEHLVDLVPETSDPSAALATFDVLAMTSWEESASLVVLEAMAQGVPVVCFRGAGGPEELIGDTGIIVDGFWPRSMAEAIAALRDHPDHAERLRGDAVRRVQARFSRDVVLPRWAAVLRREAARAGDSDGRRLGRA